MNLKTITKEEKEELIKFYLKPNSLRNTASHFNLNRYTLKKFLVRWGVELHSKEINVKIQSIKHVEIQHNKKSQGYKKDEFKVK